MIARLHLWIREDDGRAGHLSQGGDRPRISIDVLWSVRVHATTETTDRWVRAKATNRYPSDTGKDG